MNRQVKNANFAANQTQHFYDLSLSNDSVCRHYELWKAKELTLEQALILTIDNLADHCNLVMQPIPADILATFDGQHIDFVDLIKKGTKDSHLQKIEFLVKYLNTLIDLVVSHPRCQSRHFSIISSQ